MIYQGSSYVALQESIGQLPTNTEYWDCIAVGYLSQNIYDSVAEMKADDTLKDGMYAQTVGYYEANDGGGAIYKIRPKIESDIDDGGSIHVLGSLVAELITDTTVNVKQFGAYGDGTHDDSNAIQSAINLGNVLLPKGRYYLASTINIPNNRIFDGNNQTIKPAEGIYTFTLNGNTTTPVVEVKIQNCLIDSTSYGGLGIYMKDTYFIYIDNINIIKLKGDNVKAIQIINGFNHTITNSRVYGDYENYTGQIGIDISTTSGYMSNMTNNKYDTLLIQNVDYGIKANWSVTANMIEFNNIGMSACKYGMYLSGNGLPVTLSNLRFEGANRNTTETIYGLYLTGGTRPTIDTFNFYNINVGIHTTVSALTILGNSCFTGTSQSPKYKLFSDTSSGKVYDLSTQYIMSATYTFTMPTALSYSTSKDIDYGENSTQNLELSIGYNKIVKQTTTNIKNVNGKKGATGYVWTTESDLVIRGSSTSDTNLFTTDVTMTPYKLYMVDNNQCIISD